MESVFGLKEVLVNKSIKNILRIRDQFCYEYEIINDHGWGKGFIKEFFL